MEVIRQLSPPSSFHLQRYKKIPKLPNFFPTFFIFFPKNLHQPYPPTPADIVCPNTHLFPPISTDNVSANTHRFPPDIVCPNTRRFPPISTRRFPPDFRRRRVLPRVSPPAANVHGEITYTGCGLTRGKTLQRRNILG